MAWDDEEIREPERWWDYAYFKTGGADGAMSESIAPGTRFRLGEVRLRFSSIFASVEDFQVQLNCINGSEYNLMIVSEPLLGVTDLLVKFATPMEFLSDDTLTVGLSLVSAVNVYGVTVLGWAIRG